MCGRAAQTFRAAKEAAVSFGASPPFIPQDDQDAGNYNMSPGMNAVVMWKEGDKFLSESMAWGLITKNGTKNNPLPSGKQRMSMHFQNLMFNARSDTLYAKPTFARLAAQKRSCLVALDGYFEWKKSPLAGGKGKKQPYFVYSNGKSNELSKPLILAGLWTEVATGHHSEPTLKTFTILTTEPCKQIEWLHDRMPVCIWEQSSAIEWLDNPSASLLKTLDSAARNNNNGFLWHMVSPEMSNLSYRGEKVIKAMKPPASVLSFFIKQNGNETYSNSPAKLKRVKSPNAETTTPKRRKSTLFHTKGNEPAKLTNAKSRKPVKKEESSPSKSDKGLITGFFQKKI